METLNELQLPTTESRCKAVIIALVLFTTLNRARAAIIGSCPVDASFIAGVGWMLVSFVDRMVASSKMGAEFRFFMIKRILNGTKMNA